MIAYIPIEAWSALNSIVVAVIAWFSYNSSHRTVLLTTKMEEVKEIVDGPLSLALASNARLAKRLADITKSNADLNAARKAKAVHENRLEGKGKRKNRNP